MKISIITNVRYMDTKNKILNETIKTFATQGYESVTMRAIAGKIGIKQSVIYYYYSSKDSLLENMFLEITQRLSKEIQKLPKIDDAKEMFKQRITFQLDHGLEVLTLLKYFLTFKSQFQKQSSGFIPRTAYQHISNALQYGKENNQFFIEDIDSTAKVITHSINGFVLEYFPNKLAKEEKEKIITSIYSFFIKALTKGGE